jgi:Holliday junction DNA helicase RuvB
MKTIYALLAGTMALILSVIGGIFFLTQFMSIYDIPELAIIIVAIMGIGVGKLIYVSVEQAIGASSRDWDEFEAHMMEFIDGKEEEEESIVEYDGEIPEEIPEHPALSHILLYGGAGQGKTALAKVTRNEIAKAYGHDIEFIEVVPSQLKRKRELDEVMLRIASNPYALLFIDEIHGLPLAIEESLYSALQDFTYDITLTKEIMLGDGYNISLDEERGVQTIDLPKFTLIGATTLMGSINKPLKDRFPIRIEMSDYEEDELVGVIDVFMGQGNPDSFDSYVGQGNATDIIGIHIRSAMYDGPEVTIEHKAKKKIAKLSMRTARLVKQRTKNCIAYAKSIGSNVVAPDMVEKAMALFGVDKDGFDRVHRDIIRHLVKQGNKPIGSQALAEAVGVTKSDIDAVYIPELTRFKVTTRDGRSMKMLTEDAYNKYK